MWRSIYTRGEPHLHHSKSEIHSTRDFTLCRHSGKTKRAHLRGLRSSGFSRTQIVHLLKRPVTGCGAKEPCFIRTVRHISPIRSACARITHGLGTRDKYWGRALLPHHKNTTTNLKVHLIKRVKWKGVQKFMVGLTLPYLHHVPVLNSQRERG